MLGFTSLQSTNIEKYAQFINNYLCVSCGRVDKRKLSIEFR